MIHIYLCDRNVRYYAEKNCFAVRGIKLDQFLESIVIRRLQPPSYESLKKAMAEETMREKARESYLQLERERLESSIRHLSEQLQNCDPTNRRVVNFVSEKLERALEEKEKFEEKVLQEDQLQSRRPKLSQDRLQELCDFAARTPEIWRHPAVTIQDRRDILHCLIREISLKPVEDTLHGVIRWRSGIETTFRYYYKGLNAVYKIIRELHEQGCTPIEILERLNNGETSTGQVFKRKKHFLGVIRESLGLRPSYKNFPKAALQREIRERFESGESFAGIARDFNDRGIKSAKGKMWSRVTVARLNQPDLDSLHRWALSEARSRGLGFRQIADEFNARHIPRLDNRPWTLSVVHKKWVKLGRPDKVSSSEHRQQMDPSWSGERK
jgi:hypothetical protein